MKTFGVVAVAALATWLTRALPFIVFGGRKLPEIMIYLGKVLPAAIMMILVCYCLSGTDFISWPHGLPEIIACIAVALLQIYRKNMYISIVAGTICYMVLIRVI